LKYSYLVSALFIPMLFSCAQKGMPPGGPVDKTPPEVISSYPLNEAVNVSIKTKIEIEFSEGITPSSITDAVFISPFPGEDVKIKSSGSSLKIEFGEPLKSNRTYVVTLGTGLKDYRSIPMAESYTLAFSTGMVLDTCEISGRIYGETDCSGIDIWAYQLSDTGRVNPAAKEPDYIVQCSRDGSFRLTHLAPAVYRLFAVEDRLADRLYQQVEDRYGITFKDANVSAGQSILSADHNFRLTRADTSGPALERLSISQARCFSLVFDQPLAAEQSLVPDSILIRFGKTDDILAIEKLYIDKLDPRKLYLITGDSLDDGNYKVSVTDIYDVNGNIVDTAYNTASAVWAAAVDTVQPVISKVMPVPDSKDIPGSSEFHIYFSKSLAFADISKNLTMSDTLGNMISGKGRMESPREIVFHPDKILPAHVILQLKLKGSGFMDYAGNYAVDTLMNYQVVNPDTLSAISGTVSLADTSAPGRIYISARQLVKGGYSCSTILPKAGQYVLADMLPGLYVLEAFRDSDGNGRYSFGTIIPYKTAEPFTVFPDTIKIRSRWPNEGNDLILN